MYHGDNNVAAAEARYREIAKGGIPDVMDELIVPDTGIQIFELLKKAGFASSNGDARRLIQGKGIKINNETVEDCALVVEPCDGLVVSRGKNRFVKVIFKS